MIHLKMALSTSFSVKIRVLGITILRTAPRAKLRYNFSFSQPEYELHPDITVDVFAINIPLLNETVLHLIFSR